MYMGTCRQARARHRVPSIMERLAGIWEVCPINQKGVSRQGVIDSPEGLGVETLPDKHPARRRKTIRPSRTHTRIRQVGDNSR